MNISIPPRRVRNAAFLVATLCFFRIPMGLGPQSAFAQQVAYDIAFPNAVHNEAEITATFSGVPTDTLEVRMSRTSPGRYALHEFAKNIYDVRITDGAGDTLRATRPNLHEWDVGGHDGTVRVAYTLYGDRVGGTYTAIGPTHAHLNMPATFMWARDMEEAPIRIRFDRPNNDWKIATQLFETDDPETFTAPDLAYFMDSPTEVSDFAVRSWNVTANGETYPIRLVLHHRGTDEQLDEYANMAQKVTREQIAVYGETPDYDNGSYTFIADYLPWATGDGMEHRNSTILTSSQPLATAAKDNLVTLSHEFFHQWNVERIRPAGLEPFDFEKANVTGALWFAEGFTSYYDGLTIRRAGIYDNAAYADDLAGTLSYVLSRPGRRFYTPVGMSRQAPFVDAATSVDAQNKRNTFISYYSWGSVLGLGLDLTLRARYDDVTLDDYMRAMWKQYGRSETPYTLGDLERVLGEVMGDPAFAENFFARYVRGRQMMDYEALLGNAGLLLRRANPGDVWLGAPLEDGPEEDERQGAVVAANTLVGSPLYEAGLDRGDTILALGGERVAGAEAGREILDEHDPGDTVSVTFMQHGREKQALLTLAQDPAREVVPYEEAGKTVTGEMKQLRADWLGSHAR